VVILPAGVWQWVGERLASLLWPTATRRTLGPDARVAGAVVFTPDGRAVAYPILENGVSNVFVQPLDGSPGRQITNFKSGTFRTLAVIREVSQSEVLLREVSEAGSQ